MKPLNASIHLAAASALALSASAMGAPDEPVGQIVRVDGSAMISQGTRYVNAQAGMPLRVKDRILVLEGGTAMLQFADGCQYSLTDSELLTIGTESACVEQAAKAAAAEQGGVSVETAAADGQGSFARVESGATSQLGEQPAPGYQWDDQRGAWIWVGLGGIGIIAALANGDGSGDRDAQDPISR